MSVKNEKKDNRRGYGWMIMRKNKHCVWGCQKIKKKGREEYRRVCNIFTCHHDELNILHYISY